MNSNDLLLTNKSLLEMSIDQDVIRSNEQITNEQHTTSSPDNSFKLVRQTSLATAIGTSSYFDENAYVFDGVKIEIEDIDNTSLSNQTTQSLKRCKKQVLKYYYKLLCFIGWRPFYKECFYRTPIYVTILNIIYPLLIIAFLFYSYVYDIIICQGKLNVVTDILQTTTTTTTQVMPLAFNSLNDKELTRNDSSFIHTLTNFIPKISGDISHIQCGHIVTTYVIPSVLHFTSYVMGFWYFRIRENEQLYALMEKVFLSVSQTMKHGSQDKVIKRLKIFIVLGTFWVLMAMTLHVLYRLAYGLEMTIFQEKWPSVIVQGIALLIMNSVYLAVVINHATQCEMIIFYVNEIKTRLDEKSVTLKDAMQQILDIRVAIGNLNLTVSKMTSLVCFSFLEKLIIGLIILTMNKVCLPIAWTYRALFPLVWFLISSFSIIQVARLNSKCDNFKQIAISARVYGYHASTRDELDSFLLFISNASLRAKLFGIPLKTSYLLGLFILIIFTIIIMIQTSLITSPKSLI